MRGETPSCVRRRDRCLHVSVTSIENNGINSKNYHSSSSLLIRRYILLNEMLLQLGIVIFYKYASCIHSIELSPSRKAIRTNTRCEILGLYYSKDNLIWFRWNLNSSSMTTISFLSQSFWWNIVTMSVWYRFRIKEKNFPMTSHEYVYLCVEFLVWWWVSI